MKTNEFPALITWLVVIGALFGLIVTATTLVEIHPVGWVAIGVMFNHLAQLWKGIIKNE